MSFKKIFVQYNSILTPIIALGLLGAVTYYYLIPYSQKAISAKQQQFDAIQTETESRYARLKNLTRLKQDFESIEKTERDKLDLIIPAKPEVPELLIQVEKIVKDSGLLLESVSINELKPVVNQPPAAVEPVPSDSENPLPENSVSPAPNNASVAPPSLADLVATLEIQLTVKECNYGKLKLFLDKIEKNIRLLDLKTLSFKADFEAVDFTIYTYYLSK